MNNSRMLELAGVIKAKATPQMLNEDNGTALKVVQSALRRIIANLEGGNADMAMEEARKALKMANANVANEIEPGRLR